MSTYATEQDVSNYIEGWTTVDPFSLERRIQRSEQDLDLVLVRTRFELPPTQVVSLGASSGLPQAGTYQLGFNGVDTTALNYNATPSQIQSALAALSSIGNDQSGVPNVAVLGSNPYTVMWSTSWVRSNYLGLQPPVSVGGEIVYPEDYQVPLLTVDNSTLGVGSSVVYVPGRKINPLTDIDQNQRLALSNATCAQVEYRIAMGEKFFVRPQYGSVKGPDFTTSGKLPMIAPKAKRELSQVGLIHVSGRAYAGAARRGVARGWPTY